MENINTTNEIVYVATAQNRSSKYPELTYGETARGYINGDLRFFLHPDRYSHMVNVIMVTTDPRDPADVVSFLMDPNSVPASLGKLAQLFPPF